MHLNGSFSDADSDEAKANYVDEYVLWPGFGQPDTYLVTENGTHVLRVLVQWDVPAGYESSTPTL